jgi:hypothetical protein
MQKVIRLYFVIRSWRNLNRKRHRKHTKRRKMKNIKKKGRRRRRRLYQAAGRTYPTAGSRLRACQSQTFTLPSRGPLLPSQTFSTSSIWLAVLPSPRPSSRPPQIRTSRASATTAPLRNRKPTSTISWRRILQAFG